MLTSVYVYAPTAQYSGWTTDPTILDWQINGVGAYQAWQNSNIAQFPAAGSPSSPTAISVNDSVALGYIYASEIEIQGGNYLFEPQTGSSGVQLQVSPSLTTFAADQSTTVADFAVPIVNQSTGAATTTGPGTIIIDANATASFNSLTVGTNSGDTGTLDVEGTLYVTAGSLAVAQSAVLTGTIDLAAGCKLVYQSTASSTFTGSIIDSGYLEVDAGTLTLSPSEQQENTYSGGTNIFGGTLVVGSQMAIPSSRPLSMGGNTAELDLNGYTVSVSTLNTTINGGSGDVITDGTATKGGELDVYSNSTFAGSITDGAYSPVELTVNNAYLTLNGAGNNYTGTTILNTSTLQLGDGTHNGSVIGQINGTDESDVVFNVKAGSSETFNGFITDGDASAMQLTKEGAGILTLSAAYAASTYTLTEVLGGSLILAPGSALPSSIPPPSLTIDNGATLDLGGTSNTTLYDVELDDGIVNNGTLNVTYRIRVYNGTINANLSGSAFLEKDSGDQNDTVILNGSCNLTANAMSVNEGTLLVNGSLSGAVLVGQSVGSATLGGDGICSGAVTVYQNGTLKMDGSNGAALTMGSLTLGQQGQSCTITEAENTQTGLLETAQVNGALNIYGGTIEFNAASYPGFCPFQVLFHYGTLVGTGSLSISSQYHAPVTANLITDATGNCIELAESSANVSVLYWAPNWTATHQLGGGGTWNATDNQWLNTSNTLVRWPTGGPPVVAVFEDSSSTGYSVALASGFQPQAEGMFFLGDNYTIGTMPSPGALTLNGNAAITVMPGITATVNAVVSGSSGLVADLPGGTLALNNQSNNYSGGTTIVGGLATIVGSMGGMVQVPSGSCFGSTSGITFDGGTFQATGPSVTVNPPIVLNAGGATIDTNGFSCALTGQVSGIGSLTEIGGGTLTVTSPASPNANSFSGGMAVNQSTLSLGNASALPLGTNLTIDGGALVLNGLTTLALNTVTLTSSGTIGDSSGGTLQASANLNLYSGQIAAILAGSANLNMLGASTDSVYLTGANTYGGGTAIVGGTLSLAYGASYGDLPSGTNLAMYGSATDAATLDMAGQNANVGSLSGTADSTITNNSIANPVTLTVYQATDAAFLGVIQDGNETVALVVSGSAALALDPQPTGNGYSGGTTVNGGDLWLPNNEAILADTNLTISNGGALAILKGITTADLNTVTLNSGTIVSSVGGTLWSDGNFYLYNGSISAILAGSAGVYMQGAAGTVSLTGGISLSTYTGNTFVDHGTLIVTNTNGLPDGSGLTVGANASTYFNAVQAITLGPLVLGGGSILNLDGATLTCTSFEVSGNTTIVGGTLIVSTGALTVDSGETLTVYSGATVESQAGTVNNGTIFCAGWWYTGNVAGTGSLEVATTGLVFFEGNYAPTGATTVDSGGLLYCQPGASSTITISGAIGGSGNVDIAGAAGSTTIFTAVNSYTGPTFITGGTLSVSADGNLGAAPGTAAPADITMSGGTLKASAGFTLNSNRGIKVGNPTGKVGGTIDVATGQVLTYGGIIANRGLGTGWLTKVDSGTLILSGINTYSGGTTITGGVLCVSADGNLGAAPSTATPGSLVINGGTLMASAGFTLNCNRGIALGPATGSGGGTIDVASGQILTYAGILANNGSGTGALTKVDSGTLTLSGTNTFSSGETVTGGILSVSADANLGAAPSTATPGSLAINGGTLQASAGFTLNSNRGIALGATSGSGGGTIDVASGQVLSYGGIMANNGSGTGSLTKTDSGTLTVSGSNTFGGGVTLSAGTLSLGNANALGSTSGTVTDNGTLDLGGYSIASTYVTVGSGATLQDGTIALASGSSINGGTISANISGPLTIGGTGNTLSGTDSLGATTINSGAAVTNSGALTLTGNMTDSGTLTDSSGYTIAIDSGITLTVASGGALTNDGTLANSGTLAVNGAFTDVGSFTNSGSVSYGSASAIAVSGSNTLNLGGSTITVSSITVSSGGTLSNGTITASNTHLSGGTVSAKISSGGTTTVSGSNTLSGTDSLGTTTINSGATLTNSGALTLTGNLTDNGSIENTRTFTNKATLSLSSGSSLDNAHGATFSNGVSSTGSISDTGTLTNEGTFNNNASLTVNSGGSLSNSGNYADTSSNSSTCATLGGTVSNLSGGTLSNNIGTMNITGSTDNAHGATLNNSATLDITGTLTNEGSLNNNSNASLNITTGTLTNNSTGVVTNDYQITISSGGYLNNSGSFTNASSNSCVSNTFGGTVSNLSGGTISNNYGTMAITGSTDNASGATLKNSATLNVTGTLTNEGTLDNYATFSDTGTFTNNTGGSFVNSTSNSATFGRSVSNYGSISNSSGTLSISSGYTLTNNTGSTLLGNITDSGSIVFASSITYAGVISGAGSVTVNAGTGNTVLFIGANTYTGSTTITSGTLQLGNGTTNGSISSASNIVDNAILEYMETANENYGNTISGTGQVVDGNGNTITLGTHTGFTGTKTGNIVL